MIFTSADSRIRGRHRSATRRPQPRETRSTSLTDTAGRQDTDHRPTDPRTSVGWAVLRPDRTLSLHGELDVDGQAELERVVAAFAQRCLNEQSHRTRDEKAATTVVIDAAGLRFIDAAGIGVLVALQRTLAEVGIPLRTRHAPAALRRLSEICGLDDVLGLAPVP